MSPREVTEPPWLTAAADQRVTLMLREMGGHLPPVSEYPVVLMLLTEPDEGTGRAERERWERTCDNCGRYCPDDETFYTGSVSRLHGRVTMTFGACPACVLTKAEP